MFLKNQSNLIEKQKAARDNLYFPSSNLKSVRALHIREAFLQLYALPNIEDFETQSQKWYFWATHSQLVPIIKVAKTIKRHWDEVLNCESIQINNGLLEGADSVIQAAKRKARGYKKSHFKTMVCLLTGKLDLTRVDQSCLPT